MSSDFNNSELAQVHEDFTFHKGNYDDLMDDALADIESALQKELKPREKSVLSDEITALTEEHGVKFGKALRTTSSSTDRAEWGSRLAEILTEAIDLNPDNAGRIIQGAFDIEQGYGADLGILLSVAEKSTYRHKEHLNEIVAIVDRHLGDYDNQPAKDVATYKAFRKVYTNAFRRTGSTVYASTANEVSNKIARLKDPVTVEKLLQQFQKNPTDELAQEQFEKNLGMLMAENPKEGVADVLKNLRSVTQIEDTEARTEAYLIVIDALNKHIKANMSEVAREKSGIMFTALDMIMKHEKNPEVRKEVTVTAVNVLSYMAITQPAEEKGVLLIDDNKRQETFRALKRMAESYGSYVGFKDLLAGMEAGYENVPEIREELKTCMLKVLDYEDRNGIAIAAENRSAFEKEVLAFKKERNLDALIFKLLHVPHKTNGYLQNDPNKLKLPNKNEMREVVGLLGQYETIGEYIGLEIMRKIDKEKFTNIDDVILDKLEDNVGKMRFSQDVVNELIRIRTKMHTRRIQQKVIPDLKVGQWHEGKIKQEPKPQERISFSLKDLDNTGIENRIL